MMKTLKDFLAFSKETEVDIKFLLREYLQKWILLYLNKEGFFKEGVFQGGTCLRMVYENSRFSEDLDFVFKNINLKIFQDINKILEDLDNFLKNRIVFLEKSNLNLQKANENFKRYTMNFWIKEIGKISINLEFANIPSYINKIELIVLDIYNFPILCETREEILIDKIVAFGLRDYIKGRDIWDIKYLMDKISKFDLRLINKKIRDYGKDYKFYTDKTRKNLDLLNKDGEKILSFEMKRFFPKKLYETYKFEFKKIKVEVYKFIFNILGDLNEIK
ncbi:MAG: nucleotidyl transferase AbiEii/AbiGii toxin family protein [Caldisericia bacterium]